MDKNRTNYEGGADLLDDGAVKKTGRNCPAGNQN